MKLALGAVTLSLAVAACDDDEGTYGDFTQKSILSVDPLVVSIHGDEYPLTVARDIDSTYRHFYTRKDTLKDDSSKPVIGPDGNMIIHEDTIWYNSKITAHFIEYELVELPSQADTFSIRLQSNAQWKAPVPSTGGKVQWYYNYNIHTGTTSTSGGGDGGVDFRVSRNRGFKRAVTALQDIMTNYSTVLISLKFTQQGERQKK